MTCRSVKITRIAVRIIRIEVLPTGIGVFPTRIGVFLTGIRATLVILTPIPVILRAFLVIFTLRQVVPTAKLCALAAIPSDTGARIIGLKIKSTAITLGLTNLGFRKVNSDAR